MMLVDSHCHLDYPRLVEEVDDVVERARNAGIGAMVTISTKIANFEQVHAMTRRFDEVYCSVGTHPHYADEEIDVSLDQLLALTSQEKVVAIGEAGLDFYRNNSPAADQRKVFIKHIEAARQTGLPLVIHSRDADEQMAEILTDEMDKGEFPALLHCFTAGSALARTAIELGLYISFSGVLTFKNTSELRDIARELPHDRLLVESDAPFLAPEPHRGKRNEPAFVVHTAHMLASLLEVAPEEIARITSNNFFRLFNKVPVPDAFKAGQAA